MSAPPELSLSTPRRRWLQFSLRSMLVLVVLAAIGFSLWTSNQRIKENRRLQAENRRLKGELGELTIEEGQEDKVHAIAIPQVDPLIWKWRVFVPKGKHCELRTRNAVIPLPIQSSSAGLPWGEQIVTLALLRNQKNEWNWIVGRGTGGRTTIVATPEVQEMVNDGLYDTIGSSGVGSEQETMKPGTEFELLRLVMEPNQRSSIKKKLIGGIVVEI